MAELDVELCAIEVTNLRGFSTQARLSLREGLVLLVGPNNSGKTSILRILDWILNDADEAVLEGERQLTQDEFDLLVPARRTGGAARRITLEVHVADGRSRRRFQPVGDLVLLRIGVNADGWVRLNVGPPRRGEQSGDAPALELIRAVRLTTEFGLVPAARDASSESFTAALRDAVEARLERRAIHARRAGAPAEYREVKAALTQLEAIGSRLVAPLWREMTAFLPPGLARSGELRVSVSPEEFVPWLAEQIGLRLVTGDHDVDSVPPIEVGSGLQSLLELATQQAASSQPGESRILAIEEPEAFLHPSAQRTLARLIAQSIPGKLIVSTHSPLLVEEAAYGETVLVRRHRFYEPAELSDDVRASINTALLTGFGAELAFANSVLLVEGEGDRLYFEGLRRRIAASAPDGRIDELYVLPTGSSSSFCPWLRLLSSYGRDRDRPVSWLAAPDGDAAAEIRAAWDEAGLSLPSDAAAALDELAATDDVSSAEAAAFARRFNTIAKKSETGICLLPNDLEHTMLENCRPATIEALADLLGAEVLGRPALTRWLSKRKSPHMRALIARETPWKEISADVHSMLGRWLTAVMSERDARQVLKSVK